MSKKPGDLWRQAASPLALLACRSRHACLAYIRKTKGALSFPALPTMPPVTLARLLRS